MTGEERGFLILLAVNFLVAVVYFLWGVLIYVPAKEAKSGDTGERLFDGRKTFLVRAVIMLLCPVAGPLFFAVSNLFYLYFLGMEADLADVVFSKERVKTQLKADEERARNLVPMEEALAVNEKKNLRLVMMNMVRGEIQDSLASIALAMSSEDSEVSHYAASIMSDELNAFRMKVQQLLAQIRCEGQDETGCEEILLDYMNDILKLQIFTQMEQKRFAGIMQDTAETLYQKDFQRMSGERYENVCQRLLEVGETKEAEKWCQRLAQQYPQMLCAYTCRLKLYFTVKNREAFFETLEELKKSDVVIDNETLELIRVFG